jgi:hypothetical protein
MTSENRLRNETLREQMDVASSVIRNIENGAEMVRPPGKIAEKCDALVNTRDRKMRGREGPTYRAHYGRMGFGRWGDRENRPMWHYGLKLRRSRDIFSVNFFVKKYFTITFLCSPNKNIELL